MYEELPIVLFDTEEEAQETMELLGDALIDPRYSHLVPRLYESHFLGGWTIKFYNRGQMRYTYLRAETMVRQASNDLLAYPPTVRIDTLGSC